MIKSKASRRTWLSVFAIALAGVLSIRLVANEQSPEQTGGVPESNEISKESHGFVPPLIWPVGKAILDDVFLQLGPDTDPATGTWKDWECSSQFTYDGHRGTDIMAYNFRVMDQGVPVYAAAGGRVTWTQTGYFDRNYWTPYIGLPNGINIRHPDGSDSQYFHLRTNSVSVVVGDVVEAGQIIGYVGSSGSSPNPHLHFELWENGRTRDPNNGACNTRPSLWLDSLAHPGANDLTILDWDIFVDTDLSGSENNNYLGDKRLKNRAFRPVSIARTQEKLGVWVQIQGKTGQRYDIRVVDNKGIEFARSSKGVVFRRSVQWHLIYFTFGAHVAGWEAPRGAWSVELHRDGEPVRTKSFEVADRTLFPLRFYPLAGRSFRRTGGEIRDTLRVRHASGAVSYRVLGAPAGVSIQGDQVVIGSATDFQTRNANFRVVATDEASLADTMYYHVVSPNKPLQGLVTAIEEVDVPQDLQIKDAYPNPFSKSMTLSIDVSVAGEGQLLVFDMLGREVRRRVLGFLSTGKQTLSVDRASLPAGAYVVSIRTPGGSVARQVTII